MTNNKNYRIIASKEGLEYLEEQNKSIEDLSTYLIPSGYGMVYELDNGEIVLIHPRGNGDYPGFIFENNASFKKACDSDFFPIGEDNMTWLELHSNQMQGFLKEDDFILNPLKEELKLSVPFKHVGECEVGYEKLISYIRSKKHSEKNKIELMHSYALAVSKFLIEIKGYKWELKKKYEVYNPYYYPEIINGSALKVDVISNLFIAIGGANKSPFRLFYWFVTDIPMNVEIE